MLQWLKEQIEWCKGFFLEDKTPNMPSHKNLMSLGIIIAFLISFLKKTVDAADIPDVPPGWQLVLLVVLGIRSATSAAEKLIEKKYSNGDTNADKKENDK